MGFLSLLLVIAAAWLVFTGRIQRLTGRDGAMLGLAIVGAVLAARGQAVIGGVPLMISALYAARRLWPRRRGGRSGSPARSGPGIDPAAVGEARALLGVAEDADETAIRAAHRRLIAKNHPDAGGTQALAEKINEARTLLLRHRNESKGSHSPASDSPQEPTGYP